MRIGILIGSILPPQEHNTEDPVHTSFGNTSSGIMASKLGDHHFSIISRHGIPPHIPPHRIEHRANIQALIDNGVEMIISICSTGALHKGITVPGFAVPNDYIDLFSGATFIDDRIEHATPELDKDIQNAIIQSCVSMGLEPYTGGTYIQMRGPRLETKAEVKLLSSWGDLVGMNLGPEATLCSESGIRCGSLLTVDNYAHGVVDEELDFREILNDARSKWNKVSQVLQDLPKEI